MINPVGNTPYLSVNNNFNSLSYGQLFDLKANKLESDYLNNRGSASHYRCWISFLAEGYRFDALNAAMLVYRHDSAEFDAINALYLAKSDLEQRVRSSDAVDFCTVYCSQFPDDFEGLFLLMLHTSETKNSLFEDHPLAAPLRLFFDNKYEEFLKLYGDKGEPYSWLCDYFRFLDPKCTASTIPDMPVHFFTQFLYAYCSIAKVAPMPAIEEQIQKQIKLHPFNVTLLAHSLMYYSKTNDSVNADKYYNFLTQLNCPLYHRVLRSFAIYEINRGNISKALDWVKHENAIGYSCFFMRVTLFYKLKKFDGVFQVLDRELSEYEGRTGKALNEFRVFYYNKKMLNALQARLNEECCELAGKILAINPKHSEALYCLTEATVAMDDYATAWKHYENKVKLAPSAYDALLFSHIARRSFRRLNEAESQLYAALLTSPNNENFLFELCNIFFMQRKYEETVELLSKQPMLTEQLKVFREVALLRLNRPLMIPLDSIKSTNEINVLKAELHTRNGEYKKALDYFNKFIDPKYDLDALISYLKCLYELKEIKKAKDFLSSLCQERKLRLGEIRVLIERAKIEEKIEVKAFKPATPVPPVVLAPRKALFGMTENAISLMKGEFSRKPCCGNEGIDPLIYHPSVHAHLLADTSNSFIYYPNNYAIRIRNALDLYDRLKELASKKRSIASNHELIDCLYRFLEQIAPLNPNPEQQEGMELFSKRVVSTELLSALRSNLLSLPAITADYSIFEFIKEFLKLEISHSIKMSFSDPEPIAAPFPELKLSNGDLWSDYKDHIQFVLHFDVIRCELDFIQNNSHILIDNKNAIPFFVSAQRIYSSLRFISAFDEKRETKLKRIFIELEEGYNKPFDFSIVKLNKFLALARLKRSMFENI